MNINFNEILFLSFIAIFGFMNLIRFYYFYRKLFRLLNKQPKEKKGLPKLNKNKYKLIFSKDWFENKEFEYYRIRARQSLEFGIVFAVGLIVVFLIFIFHGTK